MLLSILDEKTFMIGSRTFKVGDVLDLTEMKEPVVFPWGETSVSDLNDHLTVVSELLRTTRKGLSERLHLVEDEFDVTAAQLSLDYENYERDWLFYSDFFYKAVQSQLGGQLPLIRDPSTGVITIRAKSAQESLNYMRDVCCQRVRFHQYESVRSLALHIAGNKKEDVLIESELHINTRVPLVSALREDEPNTTNVAVIDRLKAAIIATYDEVTRYGPAAGMMWSHNVDETHSRDYLLNAGALLQQGQGDPKLAFTTAIQRSKDELPKPYAMGFFIYGNMDVVEKGAKGVLISTVQGEESRYIILVVDTQQKLTIAKEDTDLTQLVVAKEGAESKLDEAVIQLAKDTMKSLEPVEETPKEE
jgi:hypothetical protein